MENNWKLPDYKTIRYTLNTSNNWHQLQSKPDRFNKLPDELKIRPVMCPRMKKQAENLIEGHTVNKRKTFFTGLSTTHFQNLYFGDDGYNQPKKKSFILFHFLTDQSVLICYFFNEYTPPATLREKFIDTFRQSLKQNK
ncbi:MAG: hypothetical protein JZU47_07850 [Prolixibacteraceae bacterium]|nr:hypothetical protein [Prolixibacteraceae bacterium]